MCLVVVGVLQSSIMVCGLLLRPIVIIKTTEEEREEGAPKDQPDAPLITQKEQKEQQEEEGAQLDAPLITQEEQKEQEEEQQQEEQAEQEEQKEEEGAQLDPLLSTENEQMRSSLDSADSGVQSLGSSGTDLPGERKVPEGKESPDPAPCPCPAPARPPLLDPAPGPAPDPARPPLLDPAPARPPLLDPAPCPGPAPARPPLLDPAPCPAPARPPLLDLSVLREWSFLCYALFGLFATLGFFAPQLYIIELSVSRGVARETAAYMLSAMAVAEIAGRLSVGLVMNRQPVRKIYILLACVVALCGVLLLFTAVTGFWGLAVCCVLYGFLLGTVCSTHIPMLSEEDVVGIDRMSSAAGIYVFIHSFACLGGPPLGGERERAPLQGTPCSAPTECQSARVPECQSARVPECQSARVPECQSARVPECQSARVPECQSARVRP